MRQSHWVKGESFSQGFGAISESSGLLWSGMMPHSLLECSLKLSNSQTLHQQKPRVNISFRLGTGCPILTFNFTKRFFQAESCLSAWVYISDIIAQRLFCFYLDGVTRTREDTMEHILPSAVRPSQKLHVPSSPRCASRQLQGCTVTSEWPEDKVWSGGGGGAS